jgi:hypothetical protein
MTKTKTAKSTKKIVRSKKKISSIKSMSTSTIKKPGSIIKSSKPAIPKTSKLPDWEVMLSVLSPTINRPRRTSLHTLAAVLGRKDPQKLADEMRKSGKVVGYVCPDIQSPIFYLKSLRKHSGMIDTASANIWKEVPTYLEKHPFPKVKGFKRFAGGKWSKGSYGYGTYIANSSAMSVPFEKSDYAYANAVIDTLMAAGYTPAIKPYKIGSTTKTNILTKIVPTTSKKVVAVKKSASPVISTITHGL